MVDVHISIYDFFFLLVFCLFLRAGWDEYHSLIWQFSVRATDPIDTGSWPPACLSLSNVIDLCGIIGSRVPLFLLFPYWNGYIPRVSLILLTAALPGPAV